MRFISPILLSALALGAPGCDANWWDPTAFPPIHDEAPVFVMPDPGAAQFSDATYGSVLVGYTSLVPDMSVTIPGYGPPNLLASRLGVSGGRSSHYAVWRAFEDHALSEEATTGLRPAVDHTSLYDACRDDNDLENCGEGASASLAAFDVFPGGLLRDGDDYGCIAAPAGVVGAIGAANERLNIRCETESNTIYPVDVPDGIELGASGVGLPAIRGDGCAPVPHPVGFALFGAPLANARTGAVFVLRATTEIHEVDFTGLTLPADASLGAELTALPLADGRLLVAVSARTEEGLADPRVVIATMTADATGVTTEVLACLGGASATEGFGRALAIGDLTDDGVPEIVVGGGAPTAPMLGMNEEPILIYSFADLDGGRLVGCMGDAPPTPRRTVDCEDVAGLSCGSASLAPTGFGGSVAIGDVNGDGIGDLITGAPFAHVRGLLSGAVISLAGRNDLAMLGVGPGNSAVAVPSNARDGMRLGAAVAVVEGAGRSEVAAGSPGALTASIFFCAGLVGDRPEDFADERGVTHGCVVAPTPGRPERCMGRDGSMDLDAGVPLDAPQPDAGDLDAGDLDAGDLDAGDLDAGDLDAGGRPVDAG